MSQQSHVFKNDPCEGCIELTQYNRVLQDRDGARHIIVGLKATNTELKKEKTRKDKELAEKNKTIVKLNIQLADKDRCYNYLIFFDSL